MKKLLLMCCLVVAAGTMAFGQVTPVSKPLFFSKVNQLNTYLQQNNVGGANVVWNEINQMMKTELSNIKYLAKTALQVNNTPQATQMKQLATQQWGLYTGVARLHNNMVPNQGTINSKLNQFGNAIQ